jgi:cobalt/nickel transport system ATP-binding protein
MTTSADADDSIYRCHTGTHTDELIHVDCASHTYPDGSVGIHEMCFYVLKKEIVVLCGINGAGKSTLIEHLNGLLTPSLGRVIVSGQDITKGANRTLWKEVGVVFQSSDDQLFAPTVLDDVMFGPLNLGMTKTEAETAARNALEAVRAADLVGKLPDYLSGGQKRLISIAGILAMKPQIIAMDEPTSDLDPVHAETVERLIRSFRDESGISIVIATHDLDFAARIADRVCLVKNGSVFAEGTPADIFYNDNLIRQAGLRAPQIVRIYQEYCRAKGIVPDKRPVSLEELIPAMIG